MCVVCGCNSNTLIPGPHAGNLHFGLGAARVSVPGMSQERTITLEANILGENDRIAAQNRLHFQAHGVTALNLLSSPGSGKTTLLCATITAFQERADPPRISVIEGDQQTTLDADRIRSTGVPAVQINTGKGCHLDAPMVAQAFAHLHEHTHSHAHDDSHDTHHTRSAVPSLLLIENVGNLVCPALWDLGESAKVVILSVTEGEDKPLKYPEMFAAAQLMLLNKVDLLPHLQFDVRRCMDNARRINPHLQIIEVSATSGQGMDAWLHWLDHAMGGHHVHAHDAGPEDLEQTGTEAALRARIATLEAELVEARVKR